MNNVIDSIWNMPSLKTFNSVLHEAELGLVVKYATRRIKDSNTNPVSNGVWDNAANLIYFVGAHLRIPVSLILDQFPTMVATKIQMETRHDQPRN